MSLDEAAVQRLIDEAEIRSVSMRFARGVDRLDWELVRSCFHDDAVDDHGFYVGDVDGMIEVLKQIVPADIATTHFLGNQEYDFTASDVAYVETSVITRHRQPPRDGRPLVDGFGFGQYSDRFEKRNNEWRIAHRLVVHQPSRIDPVAEDIPFHPDCYRATRGDEASRGIRRPETLARQKQ
ncbi:nuclear transport factor 2 family protein [Rhodococcus sp. LB1]|uniref:nuclear transport factor 2 family protein n=1 Tax=Rhodococcus sp. LB1 TaxID=1807499 RepID=UPI00079B3B3B|nr:nuclear transport factor 2 family protein [Rhodococcus sp. LB1]KXX54221.1 hypothetical protein AZG88_25185 [Rhodococcus sp. LB1]